MRTININIYQYNELSEAAKEKAYETWQGDGFAECFELRPILKQLEDYNLELKTWEYDGYNFNYSFQNPCFDDCNVQWDELTGKTALKKAMRLYDELTTRGVYYSKRYGKLYWRHNQEDTIIKSRCIVHIFKNSATIKRGAGHRFKRVSKPLAVQLLKDARHIVISDYAAPNVLQSAAIEWGQP